MNYRKKIDVPVINFPEGVQDEDRGLTGCCDAFMVLADIGDPDSVKNDVTGVWLKPSDPSDIVTFSIEKCGESGVLTQLGDVGIFPQDPLIVGFIYDWRQYLSTYGAGTYKISVNFTIAGITNGYTIGMYNLMPYSIMNAASTVRVLTTFNSYYEKGKADFSNSNFKDTIRFKGFFGDVQSNDEINNLVDKGKKVVKTTRENLNSYELKTGVITYCIEQKLRFHFLNEDGVFITDHNAFNFSYQYWDHPVVLTEPQSMEYLRGSRKGILTAVFGDRTMNDKSFYNIQ